MASIACQTLLGPNGSGAAYNAPQSKPTQIPSPTPQPLTTRLSGEDLPELEFGPPGESVHSRGRPRLSGPAWTLDSQHFRIHYTLEGEDRVPATDANDNEHPDYVEEVGRAFEFAWSAEIDHFGWDPPPADEGLGGDGRYDIYLQNIMDEEYAGYTDSDAGESMIGDNPQSPSVVERYSTYSHIVIDNDYIEYEDYAPSSVNLIEYMRSTAAHEFNHALQFGYDGREPHDWFWEAIATWMEEEVFDSINEVVDTLPAVFKSPDTCQLAEGGEERSEDSDHWYGMWILMRYISERYGHQAVHRLWELAATQDGYQVWDAWLSERGLDMQGLFTEYSLALLTRDFQEGLSYPVVRLEGMAKLSAEFIPNDGVEQLGADYVEIPTGSVITLSLNSEGLVGVVVGITDERSLVYPMRSSQITINATEIEHVYLIVMNLERASGLASCHPSEYSITTSPGRIPVDPGWMGAAANFQLPRVETLKGFGGMDE